jgi:hypothetical protein
MAPKRLLPCLLLLPVLSAGFGAAEGEKSVLWIG